MLLYTIPRWVQQLFPLITWKVKTDKKEVYLTFDDGPHPQITPWVMDLLAMHGAKATFFCVGENVERYPEVYQSILHHGHRTGNHTQHHVNGWKVTADTYLAEIGDCSRHVKSDLFRPPYGRLPFKVIRRISESYRIVMWSLLSGDFLQGSDVKKHLVRMKRKIRKGSIIVFHDSEKARKNMEAMLPDLLNFLHAEGYSLKSL